MVKLSRIVKKIVSNSEQKDNKKKDTILVNESYASKGKLQPTIDFGNLPSFETIKLAKENEKKVISNTRIKKVIKTNKNKEYKNKSDKVKHEKYKSKLFDRNRFNDSKSDGKTKFELNKEEKDVDRISKGRYNDVNYKKKIKVIKNDELVSRGKRKRELKKEAWRRKHEFKSEAKKIIEQFQKEDKHGKALGDLSGLKGQLEQMEQNIRSRNELTPMYPQGFN